MIKEHVEFKLFLNFYLFRDDILKLDGGQIKWCLELF